MKGSNTTPPSGVVSFLDTTNANYPLATTNLNLGGGTSALSFINSYTLFGPSIRDLGFLRESTMTTLHKLT